jgi:catecholate siderophore receptor
VGGTVGLGLALGGHAALAQSTGQPPPTAPAPSTTEPRSTDQAPAPIPMKPVEVSGDRSQDYRILQPSDTLKLPEPLKDIPQSITIVPPEIMRERAEFTLRDGLRNVTGISFAAGEGGIQGDNLTLRGFSARNDIFRDGIRDSGAFTRDTFNIESIEVLKGPSSVLFGRGSTGGVINQVSKVPHLGAAYSASVTGGNGPFIRGAFDVNQPFGDSAAFRLTGMAQHAGVVDRDEVEGDRWGIAPAVTVGLGTSTRLTLSYLYQKEDNTPDDGLPYLFGQPAPVDRSTFYGLPDRDFEKTDVHVVTARFDHAFNADLTLRDTLRYGLFLRDHEITAPRIAGTPTPTTPLTAINVNRGHPSRDREDSILVNQTDVTYRLQTWGLEHLLLGGLEVARETADTTTFTVAGIPVATLVSPNHFPDLSGVTRVVNQRQETTAYSLGVYLMDQLTITDWLKLIAGLRYDLFDAEFKNVTLGQRFDRTDDFVSPRLAVVVQPTAWQSYYFSYGTSFNPSAEALTLAANNANTPPEENRAFELGAKWDFFGGRLGVTAALFRIEKTNARTNDPNLGVLVLDGEQRVDGAELGVTGTILPGWKVFAGYTYLDSEILKSKDLQNGIPIQGKHLANVPEHTFTLWTTYDIGKWQVGGGLTYVSDRFATNSNDITVPDHVLLDATVAYRPTRWLEIRLNVLNLTDEAYFDQVYQAHVVPGPGRTFLLSANFNF